MGGIFNGAPLPNWFKLAVLFAALGFQAAVVWSGQQSAVRELSGALRNAAVMDSVRTAEWTHQFLAINDKLDRRTNQTNIELQAIGAKVRYIARKIE